MMYKLTVITINLNNADGLQKTLHSVMSQTSQNFEYIIIDGASGDGSVEFIKQFASQQALFSPSFCLKWISERDTGVYQALNKGIQLADGEYLLFLNSGDFFYSKTVVETFLSQNYFADIVCGRCAISKNDRVVHITNPPDYVTFGTLYNGEGLAHQSTFIKRKLFNSIGFYREDFRYNSDIDFWYKAIILNNASTVKHNYIVCDYNLAGISSVENNNQQFAEEHKQILSHPIFQRIIPDYDASRKEEESLAILKWAYNKIIIRGIINLLYALALRVKRRK